MDWVTQGNRLAQLIKKYRYVLLVLLTGVLLMAFPDSDRQTEQAQPQQTVQEQPDLQSALEDILAQIEGAGKVRVLLTQAAGEQTLFQTDEDITTTQDSSDIRRETVIVSDSALVRQVNPPVYQGAVVVCQGGNNAAVRLAVVEAVASVTGLTTDHITVLKMK